MLTILKPGFIHILVLYQFINLNERIYYYFCYYLSNTIFEMNIKRR